MSSQLPFGPCFLKTIYKHSVLSLPGLFPGAGIVTDRFIPHDPLFNIYAGSIVEWIIICPGRPQTSFFIWVARSNDEVATDGAQLGGQKALLAQLLFYPRPIFFSFSFFWPSCSPGVTTAQMTLKDKEVSLKKESSFLCWRLARHEDIYVNVKATPCGHVHSPDFLSGLPLA